MIGKSEGVVKRIYLSLEDIRQVWYAGHEGHAEVSR